MAETQPDDGGVRHWSVARDSRWIYWLTVVLGSAISVIALAFAYDLELIRILEIPEEQALPMILGAAFVIIFLGNPVARSGPLARAPWSYICYFVDIVLAAVGFGICLYFTYRYNDLIEDFYFNRATAFAVGIVIIPLIIEALRRTAGWSLVAVVSCFFVYALVGHLVPGDLRDQGVVDGLIAAAGRDAPPLGLLVNNASLFENDSAHNMSLQSWDDHLAVNLRAPVFLARDFAKTIGDDHTGVVVNLLDNKMFALNPDFFSYTIAKYGLLGATKVLAMELAPRVRVCGIAPGITLPSTNQSEARFEVAHALNPMGKGATLAQLVAALRFILAAPAMTGEVITIDGGQSLQGMPRDVSFLAEE